MLDSAMARCCKIARPAEVLPRYSAKMHPKNWTDLSYLVALARTRRLALASERLKVDATTISRRIATLEKALGARLFEREKGSFSLTAAGQLVAIRAERIEFEIDEIKREVTGIDTQVAGVVRVSAPPWMVNHVLVPSLIKLQEKHTALTVELIAEAKNVDVMRREADIAVTSREGAAGGCTPSDDPEFRRLWASRGRPPPTALDQFRISHGRSSAKRLDRKRHGSRGLGAAGIAGQ